MIDYLRFAIPSLSFQAIDRPEGSCLRAGSATLLLRIELGVGA